MLDQSIFDPSDPDVKHDIIQTIIQYLQDEGYHGSSMVVQDETNVKIRNTANKRGQMKRMKRAILDGDWPEVERLLARATFKNLKAFRYAVYRQQFLELIEAQESQKAFSLLQQRLKELEAYAHEAEEFRDLCYLLTCKSVAEAPSFRNWDGVASSRVGLVEQYSRLLEFDAFQREGSIPKGRRSTRDGIRNAKEIPPGRLVQLLQQALAFQIGSSRHMPKAPPRIGTILEDFESVVIPNTRQHAFVGHYGNVKCVSFVGIEGCTLASGSSDNTIRVWETSTSRCKALLKGHRSRIWDISATANGTLMASGSGDGTVRIWDTSKLVGANTNAPWPVRSGSERGRDLVGDGRGSRLSHESARVLSKGQFTGVDELYSNGSQVNSRDLDHELSAGAECKAVLYGHSNDVYAVRFHQSGNAVVSGGYDRCVRLYDTATQQLLKTFNGHKSCISSIAFNARGNMIMTGSKDSTIKFWDIVSGLCVKTMSSHLGEVTSVETNESGTLLLSSSKDNSNRLWDMRTSKAVRRFKGHENTSKNFIRTGFGPSESVVIGGSEDGYVYIWDVETTEVVGKLGPGDGPVYEARWNSRQSLLASCGHDGIVSSWCYDADLERQ